MKIEVGVLIELTYLVSNFPLQFSFQKDGQLF
jgi:hypothetical protein